MSYVRSLYFLYQRMLSRCFYCLLLWQMYTMHYSDLQKMYNQRNHGIDIILRNLQTFSKHGKNVIQKRLNPDFLRYTDTRDEFIFKFRCNYSHVFWKEPALGNVTRNFFLHSSGCRRPYLPKKDSINEVFM